MLIRGDGEGQYQAVIDVMNACHQGSDQEVLIGFSASGNRFIEFSMNALRQLVNKLADGRLPGVAMMSLRWHCC